MHDGLDVPLEDSDIREEVELVSSLMVAAGSTEETLSPEQIDELLGIHTLPGQPDRDDVSRREH